MLPSVSVIIPCLNEETTIHLLLDALLHQTYPVDRLEVIVADALSTDGTRQIIGNFQSAHPELRIHIVDNPKRYIPSGLNVAVKAATGEYVVRLDAHSIPQPDYIDRCIQAHLQGLAENVGGVWDIRPQDNSFIARSIAAAAAHPLAVGDAKYRYTDKAEYVDTVPFGSFKKTYLEQLGGFDESLLTNEDYELNTRIRQAGGRVWLDPKIRMVYFSRRTLKDLIRQYWRYGYWKAQMIRRYPKTLRPRQALPPLFVFGLLITFIVGIFLRPALWGALAMLGVYLLILTMVGIQVAINKRNILMVFGVPPAIAAMQLTWGIGFLVGLAAKQKI